MNQVRMPTTVERIAALRRLKPGLLAMTLLAACHGSDSPKQAQGGSTPDSGYSFSSCTSGKCEVALTHVAVISDSAEPGMLSDRVYVRRDSHGRFVTISGQLDRLLIFDSTGRFARSSGRGGDGPGEFLRLTYVTLGRGDSIFAWDLRNRRVSVFGPDAVFVRQFTSPAPPMFLQRDGSFIVAEQIPQRELIGYPLHVIADTGGFIRSFGAESPEFRQSMSLLQTRTAAPAVDGSVWAVAPGRYVLENWDPTTGRRRQNIPVKASWFEESSAPQAESDRRPKPLIQRIWADSVGFVWVITRVADAEWHPPTRSTVERRIGAEELDAAYDWIIDVINPRDGTIVSSRRLAIAHDTRSPTDYLVARRYADSAHVSFDVWRPYLRRKGE